MHCKNPFVKGNLAYGCGQCMVCRINKRRIWTHRIMLEASQYAHNNFTTLTYDDEHLPPDGSLQPGDLRNFIKRLRKYHGKLRYFSVGEYGDETERPHYHLALFNVPACARGYTTVNRRGYCCSVCADIAGIWNRGNIFIGALSEQSAGYIAGYVTKKLTNPADERLQGRYPEFSRMSLKPGIGGGMTDEIASTLLKYDLERTIEDVPYATTHGNRQWPLGRYLRKQLRLRIGRSAETPATVIAQLEAQMSRLLAIATLNAPRGHRAFYFKQEIIDAGEGKRIRLEARNKPRKKVKL